MKFKVGDIVRSNKIADELYGITCDGFIGRVVHVDNTGQNIGVVPHDSNDHKNAGTPYTVESRAFDLYEPETTVLSTSEPKTSKYKVGDRVVFMYQGSGHQIPKVVVVKDVMNKYVLDNGKEVIGTVSGIKEDALHDLELPDIDTQLRLIKENYVWYNGRRCVIADDTVVATTGFVGIVDPAICSRNKTYSYKNVKFVHFSDLDKTHDGKTFEMSVDEIERKLGFESGTLRIKK